MRGLASMRILRFWAYVFAALASVSLGVEAERFWTAESVEVEAEAIPGVRTRPSQTLQALSEWQPLSTEALWQQIEPTSLDWLQTAGPEYVHENVWSTVFVTLLELPPAAWLGGIALVLLVLARLRVGQPLPSPGGLRSLVRVGGLALAGVGFGLVGADLFQAAGAWAPRPVEALWSAVDAGSLEGWGRESFLAATLQWPAWLALVALGSVLAFLARPRMGLAMYPYLPPGTVVRPRYIDLTRTKAYLDSMRSWPPRSRRSERVSAGESHPLE